MNSFMEKSAQFSEDRRYRYSLWRRWDTTKPYALFICLNPSTADENVDDNTVRFCTGFVMRLGFGAFCMANIFAYRATNPKEMKAQLDPVGPANDAWLCSLAVTPACGLIVAAWGKDGNHHNRALNVWRLLHGYSDGTMVALPPIKCLGKLKDGNPHHPLYMDATTSLIDYELSLQVDEKKA